MLVWIITLTCYYSVAAVSDENWAGCSDKQKNSCKHARKSFDVIEKGTCTKSSYDYFTHMCTIDTLLSHPNFCCCEYESNTMCCRYDQSPGVFRCNEDVDIVGMSRKMLLTVVLCPVIIVFICGLSICCAHKKLRRKLCCCPGSSNRRKPASLPRSLYTHPPHTGPLPEPRSASPDTEGSAPMLLQSMEPTAPPAAPATAPPTAPPIAPPYDHTILEPPPPYTE